MKAPDEPFSVTSLQIVPEHDVVVAVGLAVTRVEDGLEPNGTEIAESPNLDLTVRYVPIPARLADCSIVSVLPGLDAVDRESSDAVVFKVVRQLLNQIHWITCLTTSDHHSVVGQAVGHKGTVAGRRLFLVPPCSASVCPG